MLKTAGPDSSRLGSIVVFIVVPDKKILAECVVVNACVCSILLLGCVFICDAQPCFAGCVKGIDENDLLVASTSMFRLFRRMCHSVLLGDGKSCCISPFLWVLRAFELLGLRGDEVVEAVRQSAMRCCSAMLVG